ncbi:MAG: hypothetical protein HUU24_13565 [Phycisphaerae bacterium]|nr:hypothetical protein [Phycisphaerae bacterium]
MKACPDLRTHVRVTPEGRTELARLRMNPATIAQPATAGDAKPEAAGKGAASNGAEAGAKGNPENLHDAAFLSPRALADAFGIPNKADALRTRLNRWRKTNHNGWVENADRSGTEPKFTYHVGAVRHIVEALKSGN